jgi:putative Mg2+ transporter-C (MgtC) family protein
VWGFLGAGTIINGSGEEEVKGLTTAAGIWMTATIGVARTTPA